MFLNLTDKKLFDTQYLCFKVKGGGWGGGGGVVGRGEDIVSYL